MRVEGALKISGDRFKEAAVLVSVFTGFVWTKIIIIKNPGSYRLGKEMDVRCNYIENQK